MNLIVLCIVPEDEIIDEIRADYSARLSSKKALHLPPHMTLVGRFYTQDYNGFLKALQKKCLKLKEFLLEFNEIGYFDDSHILYLKPVKTKQLQKLHETLLELVSRFREPWTRDALKIETGNLKQQEYIGKYGSPYVKQFYNPHITLAGPDIMGDLHVIIGPFPKKVSFKTYVKEVVILRKNDESWVFDKKVRLGH